MTVQEKKKLVAAFLAHCNEYAAARLAAYRERLGAASGWQELELQDKISHWTAYRAFNEYTIEELATGALDEWLSEPQSR